MLMAGSETSKSHHADRIRGGALAAVALGMTLPGAEASLAAWAGARRGRGWAGIGNGLAGEEPRR